MSCIVASDSGSKSSISSSKALLGMIGELLKHGFQNLEYGSSSNTLLNLKPSGNVLSYFAFTFMCFVLKPLKFFLKSVLNNTMWFIPKVSLLTYLYLGGGWNPQMLEQLNLESVSLPSSLLSLYGIFTRQPQVGWLLKYTMLHSINGSLYSCQKLCFSVQSLSRVWLFATP